MAMRYCRFHLNGQDQYGLVESIAGRDSIVRILVTPPEEADGDMESLRTRRIDPIPLDEATLQVPVRPSKIVCIGRNYREHAAELGHDVPKEPLLFLKATSALLPPHGTIRRPKISERVDHEGELGIVIGRTCYQPAPDADIRQYILGYTCVNDVTARDLQNKDGQWSRAKGFDTFCPVGPVVTDEIDPWVGIGVETRVNGELRQQGNTRDLIFNLEVLIRHIAQAMTLFPGDLIPTGTPSGVGPLAAGNTVEVTVEGIGTLRNPVADE
ncbi:MAG TPA: fumarylacetoacetate hydrolase family protein [Candidatus Sulfotelmatobacter sp.]|nr:fumarylacetoacetate hydrolase family protein [Candidatus Sulfotelmatobacter sp.]